MRRRSASMEGLFTLDDRKERRSDVENSEDERRRLSIGSLKKKALNASNKITHSLKKRGKRKVEHRSSSFTIEDVRDEQEERAVFTIQQELLNRNLLPDKHNDYHLLLRFALWILYTVKATKVWITPYLYRTLTVAIPHSCCISADFWRLENLTLRKQSKCGLRCSSGGRSLEWIQY